MTAAQAFPGATGVTLLDVYDWPTADGLRRPMYSSPPLPSGVITRPGLNEAGPRQNSPPYPALSRPAVVGLPNGMMAPRTLRSVVRKASSQASVPGSTRAPICRRSCSQVSPSWVTQVSCSSTRSTPSLTVVAVNSSCRIRPLLGS